MTLEQKLNAKKLRLAKLLARRQQKQVKNESMTRRLEVEIKTLENELNK